METPGFSTTGIKVVDYPIESVKTGRTTMSRNGLEFLRLSPRPVPVESRKKRHNRGGLDHPAAKASIGNPHVSGCDRVDQARHTEKRITTQLQRITEAVVDPAQDHTRTRSSPSTVLEKHASVAHAGVACSLNQRKTQVSCNVRMFEISLVVRAGCQQNDARITAFRPMGCECTALGAENGASLKTFELLKTFARTSDTMVRFSSAYSPLRRSLRNDPRARPPPPVGRAGEINCKHVEIRVR